MPDRTVDRRVRRTKRRLKEALLELIEERDYEGITIEEITRRADVGRSTFYSHYADKEDLLFSGFDRWLLSLAEELPAARRPGDEFRAREDVDRPGRFRFSLPLLRHIETQKRFFQATIARGSNIRVRRKTTALLVELVRRELDRMSDCEARTTGEALADLERERLREARAHGVVGAFLGVASWWVASGQALSAEEVEAVFQDLAARRAPSS